jgi:hypothetical protein
MTPGDEQSCSSVLENGTYPAAPAERHLGHASPRRCREMTVPSAATWTTTVRVLRFGLRNQSTGLNSDSSCSANQVHARTVRAIA